MQNHQYIKTNSNADTAQHCTWVTQTKLIQTEQVFEPWPGWNCGICGFFKLSNNSNVNVEDPGGSEAMLVIETDDTSGYVGGAAVNVNVTPGEPMQVNVPVSLINGGNFIMTASETDTATTELASTELSQAGEVFTLSFTPTQSTVQFKVINTQPGAGMIGLGEVDFAVLMPTAVNVLVRVCDESEDWRFGSGGGGQEKLNEISGLGNHHTALFWEYDSRLGRRWNLDPKPQIYISDYATFANSPVWIKDPLGDKTWVYNQQGKRVGTIPDKSGNVVIILPNEQALEIMASYNKGRSMLPDARQADINRFAVEARKNGTAYDLDGLVKWHDQNKGKYVADKITDPEFGVRKLSGDSYSLRFSDGRTRTVNTLFSEASTGWKKKGNMLSPDFDNTASWNDVTASPWNTVHSHPFSSKDGDVTISEIIPTQFSKFLRTLGTVHGGMNEHDRDNATGENWNAVTDDEAVYLQHNNLNGGNTEDIKIDRDEMDK